LSARITAHSAAVTWGWLRWPVYLGLILAAVWIGTHLHSGDLPGHLTAGGLGLVLAAAAAFAFPRCPRCSHHVFGRNEDGSRRLFRPRQRCGKCNLDLTRYTPADPRAKKE
jgi:ribosomal protein S27AE